ncbi:MAG: hypothetical protein K8T20_10690 [Planctomycetes bacterium]|nr:hypothetical protein [Planctomycetota bacterium]
METSAHETADLSKSLEARLAVVDLDMMLEALALDWLDTSAEHWSGSWIWQRAAAGAFRDRGIGLARRRKNEAERLLRRAGVSKTQIEHYIEAIPDESVDDEPDFPLSPPELFDPKGLTPELATTDFLLRCEVYDRADMAGYFSMDRKGLALIQPERVLDRIPSMEVKGLHFVDAILRRQIEGGRQGIESLNYSDDPAWRNDFLRELFKRAHEHCPEYDRERLWGSLAGSGPFEDVCVDAALAELESEEKAAAAAPKEGASYYAKQLRKNLKSFLAAARASRDSEASPDIDVKDLRDWFAKHPPKPEK